MNNDGSPARFFSETVHSEVRKLWNESKQPISFAETLAVVLAKVVWGDDLCRGDIVIAVDNVAAQQSLIRLSTPSGLLGAVVKCSALADKRFGLRSWVTWVPSEANVADAPSRGECEELQARGAIRDHVSKEVWDLLKVWLTMSDEQIATTFCVGHE
eukprot:4123328-Amphidinium_carterae.1